VDEKGDEEGPVRGIICAIARKSSTCNPFFCFRWILTEDEQPSPMIVVDFIVFKTLPDPKPVVVRRERPPIILDRAG
jgi:hypothetical protein